MNFLQLGSAKIKQMLKYIFIDKYFCTFYNQYIFCRTKPIQKEELKKNKIIIN